MTRLTPCLCALASWIGGCGPRATGAAPKLLAGDEWVHDPSRLIKEDGQWAIYGSGTQGMALTRSVVDLETGQVSAPEGLDADTLASGWWREVQEWNPTGEFDAPTVSDDGQLLAFTVFDEEDGQLRDVTGIAVRTEDGFVASGVILASQGEASHTARAMDASFVHTDDGTFLVFGSHAGGIFITELDPTTGLLLDDGETPETHMASERFSSVAHDEEAGIEAPYIHANDDYFYLFVNKGQCCRGLDSTYRVEVGRATDIAGPYLDRAGNDLRDGGGSPFLDTRGRFIGPGHVGIRESGLGDMVGVHFYDGEDHGVAKYAAYQLSWEDGWPVIDALQATHTQ